MLDKLETQGQLEFEHKCETTETWLCCVRLAYNGKCLLTCLYIWFQFRSLYMTLQSKLGKCWIRVHVAAGLAASLMFQTPSLCMCCSSQMSICFIILPPSFLVSSVWQSISFLCAKHTDDSPSLILCSQLVLADAWLALFSAAMSQTASCLFSLSKFFFCRCYKSGSVRFSFNFRHWLFSFHQPIAISQRLGL